MLHLVCDVVREGLPCNHVPGTHGPKLAVHGIFDHLRETSDEEGVLDTGERALVPAQRAATQAVRVLQTCEAFSVSGWCLSTAVT